MDDRTSVFVDAVQATRERMYRVARMMLRTDADAEDAVSTATMIAWKQLPRLRNLDALPAYLTRCTVNAARAMLRRRKRETLMDAAHLPERPGAKRQGYTRVDVPAAIAGKIPAAVGAAIWRGFIAKRYGGDSAHSLRHGILARIARTGDAQERA